MPALIRAIAFIVPLLLAITGIAQAQQATLIIHNNTDATLSIVTQNAHSSSIQSQPVVVPPLSREQATVPMGQSVILAEAIHMTGTPDASWSYNFHHSGRHEIEIFATDFGLSAMFDAPGAATEGATLPEPPADVLAQLQAIGLREVAGRRRAPGTCATETGHPPIWYLIDYRPGQGCPEGYFTGGTEPPGSRQAQWCAFCGSGFETGRLDRFRCCIQSD